MESLDGKPTTTGNPPAGFQSAGVLDAVLRSAPRGSRRGWWSFVQRTTLPPKSWFCYYFGFPLAPPAKKGFLKKGTPQISRVPKTRVLPPGASSSVSDVMGVHGFKLHASHASQLWVHRTRLKLRWRPTSGYGSPCARGSTR